MIATIFNSSETFLQQKIKASAKGYYKKQLADEKNFPVF